MAHQWTLLSNTNTFPTLRSFYGYKISNK